ncbi:MAG TPA: 2Fe-2S ferredoxin-like protein [Pasteurellaceae bacterium]|nr:2Fe-2S ferredoxin-like protein [Pasteurellaceae bacterium]
MSKIEIYNIHITNKNRCIQHSNNRSLLSSLEQNDLPHEYQCRSGYCGSCRVKMKKGKVSYKVSPLAFVNENEILLCCCQVEQDLEIEL